MNITMSHKSRSLLIKSLGISLVVHLGAITFFYFHPFILQEPFKSLFGITAATPTKIDVDDENLGLDKNRIIQEVFEHVVVIPPHLQQPYDLIELPKGIALAPTEEEIYPHLPHENSFPQFMLPKQEFAAADLSLFEGQKEGPFSDLFPPDEIRPPMASQLQIDAKPAISEIRPVDLPAGQSVYEDLIAVSDFSIEASYESDYNLNLSPQLVSPNTLKIGEDLQLKVEKTPQAAQISSRALNLESEKVRSTLFIPKTSRSATEKKELTVASALDDLEQYDFPAMAMAAEWNNEFDIDVTFLPNPDGQGYIFSLSIQPNYDFSSHSLKQNLYFILDRSNSVQKHRFAVFKRAVLKALASMQQGDTFNILIIDKKITSFSPQNLPVKMKNIQAAEEFLDRQEAGGLFTAGEIYTSLEKILAKIPDNDEFHTAILLTDGKSELNYARKQSALKKWIEKNNGKLSLYAAAVGQNNDLLTLDMLCNFSGGKLLYSDTHASLPRKLAKLVLDLKDPLIKDLMITAFPGNPNSHIEFFPACSHLPSLYSHQPYVLLGQIDDPCSFDLVIQGRHRENWIAIKKNVSFVDGQKGDQALEMKLSAQKANLCYAKFLNEGKPAHLKEARDILKKSRREIAFD